MKSIAEGAILAGIMAMSNLVGGGVVLLIGQYMQVLPDDSALALIGWVTIMAVAVFAAVCFIEGAMLQAKRFIERRQT